MQSTLHKMQTPPLPAATPALALRGGPVKVVTPASARETPPPPTPPPGAGTRPVIPLDSAAPRDRILAHLSQRPGIHLRALQRRLDMDVSSLVHHLRTLERQDRIVIRNIGHFKALYPVAGVDQRDRDILFFLGQKQTQLILDLLVTSNIATHTHIAAVLQVAPATCSFHLKRLRTAGLLHGERFGRTMYWSLEDPGRVADLLQRFSART